MEPVLQPRATGNDNQHGRANNRSTHHSISADAHALGYQPIGNQDTERVERTSIRTLAKPISKSGILCDARKPSSTPLPRLYEQSPLVLSLLSEPYGIHLPDKYLKTGM